MKILKQLAHIIIDMLTKTLSKKKSTYKTKSIIITKTDAIGDYLLFRNFFSIIKDEFKDYDITLVGNIDFMGFALHLDKNHINNFIWIDNKKFRKKILYTIKILNTIKQYKYDIFINPLHSRDMNNIFLASQIKAEQKIAPLGDCVNINPKIKNKSDKIYTRLLLIDESLIFEFYKNNAFINNLVGKIIKIKPHINRNLFNYNCKIKNYSVLFIGANADYRKYNIENFAIIGSYLINKYNQSIIICSGKEDIQKSRILESKINKKDKVINMVGKTNLISLGSIVYNSKLLISNDTSCAHLGVLLDKPYVIVISNGNHFGRFIPYPKELSNKYYFALHPDINKYKTQESINKFKVKSELNINEIKPKQIIKIIDSIFKTTSLT